KWYELLRQIWPLALVATGLGLAALMLAFRRRKPLDAQGSTIFLLIFSLVFPALFDATFRALIDYEIKPRYYLTLAPVLILLVVCLGHHAFEQCERLVRGQRAKTLVFRSILALLVAYTVVLHAKRTYIKHTEPGADWERMYALFKADNTLGTAYMIHLVSPDNQRPGYYSERFYYTEHDVRPVALRLQPDLVSDCQRSSGPLARTSLYFTVRYGWADVKKVRRKLQRALPDAVIRVFPGNSVVHIRPKEPGGKAALRFFEALTQHLRRVPESYNAYRGLADLRLCHGDYDGASAAVKAMRALDPDSRTLTLLAKQMDARIRRAKAGEQKPRVGPSTAL
ncbi:MAG TPA: hypothetical protein VN764_13280, partial [Polyangiaceae bacterium]|nr:hypothetical protein [Polyangiaceae bacterium]